MNVKNIFLASCAIFSSTLALAKQKPNIIFYLADDQNVLDYGCYGNEKVHMPAVDQLAREGMRFNHAYTGQAICAPSRTMLYTAKYPLKTGVFINHITAKKGTKSIAHYLKELGYDVILAGKSHVGPSSVFDWTQYWKPEQDESKTREVLPLEKISDYLQHTDHPFCMFVASDFPHGPFPKVGEARRDEIKLFPYHSGTQANLNSMKGYYENIKDDNDQLEKVLKILDKSGKANNTIFFYSADHGKDGKFTVYDRGLNVPLVIRWPGVVKPGSVSNSTVLFIDVMPTLIDVLGGRQPDDIDGKSFLPVLKGKETKIHPYIYGVRTNQNIQNCSVFPSRMVQDDQYSYIRNFNAKEVVNKNLGTNKTVNAFILMGAEQFRNVPFEELYDIKNDPFEQHNLANDPMYAKIKAKLVTQLYKWMADQGDFLVKDGSMPLLKPTLHPLDKNSKWHKVPKDLVNSLTPDDYMKTYY